MNESQRKSPRQRIRPTYTFLLFLPLVIGTTYRLQKGIFGMSLLDNNAIFSQELMASFAVQSSKSSISLYESKRQQQEDDDLSVAGSYLSPKTSEADYAYAFLLGGINLSNPNSYLGFLYNDMVAARILKESGSQADLIMFLHFAEGNNTTSTTTINDEQQQRFPQEDWLRELGFRIVYIPAATSTNYDKDDDFHTIQMLKFHILELVEYRRVIYLDSDMMPACNLDYMFEMSDSKNSSTTPVLKENLVLQWTEEPANGGFFMLKPNREDFHQLQHIYHTQRSKFTVEKGWGHVIDSNVDLWKSIQGNGTLWDFYAADSDQGLLYHWVKYVKQSVTLVQLDNIIENWTRDENGNSILQGTYSNVLPSCLSKEVRSIAYYPAIGSSFVNQHPYSHIVHFYGHFKPWQKINSYVIDDGDKYKSKTAKQFWYYTLRELNELLDMGIDFSKKCILPNVKLTRPNKCYNDHELKMDS